MSRRTGNNYSGPRFPFSQKPRKASKQKQEPSERAKSAGGKSWSGSSRDRPDTTQVKRYA